MNARYIRLTNHMSASQGRHKNLRKINTPYIYRHSVDKKTMKEKFETKPCTVYNGCVLGSVVRSRWSNGGVCVFSCSLQTGLCCLFFSLDSTAADSLYFCAVANKRYHRVYTTLTRHIWDENHLILVWKSSYLIKVWTTPDGTVRIRWCRERVHPDT